MKNLFYLFFAVLLFSCSQTEYTACECAEFHNKAYLHGFNNPNITEQEMQSYLEKIIKTPMGQYCQKRANNDSAFRQELMDCRAFK